MAQSIREIMTADPRTVDSGATVAEAAREMRDGDVGSVVVVENGTVAGIVTDRDIAVRVVAQGLDPDATRVSEIATMRPVTLTVDQSVDDAIRLVREQDVRRIIVVQDDRAAGIVSLGDLAIERDTVSALDGATATEPDETGAFEVSIDCGSQDDALDRVWDAVAASGADDHIAFLEHPALPEHWRHRAAGAQP